MAVTSRKERLKANKAIKERAMSASAVVQVQKGVSRSFTKDSSRLIVPLKQRLCLVGTTGISPFSLVIRFDPPT